MVIHFNPSPFSCATKEQSRQKHPLRNPFLRTPEQEIAGYKRVEGEYIGYAAIKSQQYQRYKLLTAYPDSRLLELTRYKSAAVKVHAFNALVERNSPQLVQVFMEHIDDTTSFETMSGCIGSTAHVNAYFFCRVKHLLPENQAVQIESKIFGKRNDLLMCAF